MAGYTQLGATDKLSDSRSTLNGIETRRVQLDFTRQHGSPATSRGINGQFFREDASTGDRLHSIWLVCDRVANDTDVTLTIHFFLNGAPLGGDDVAFDVEVTYIDITDNTESAATIDATLSTGDIALSGAGTDTYWQGSVTIPNASLGDDIHLVGIAIERVAPSGTDYLNDLSIVCVEARYTIQR